MVSCHSRLLVGWMWIIGSGVVSYSSNSATSFGSFTGKRYHRPATTVTTGRKDFKNMLQSERLSTRCQPILDRARLDSS